MSAPRILHVSESWRPRLSGYTTRGWALVETQRREGIARPSVLVTSRQATYGFETAEAPEGVHLSIAPVSPREGFLRRVRSFYVDAGALRREIVREARETSAEAIHVHWGSGMGRAAAQAARTCGLPLVAEVRFDLAGAVMTETVRREVPALERALRRRFEAHVPGAAAVVAASDTLGALVRRTFPETDGTLWVVPNGVDAARFAPPDPEDREALRQSLGVDNAFVVGTTSNMLRYEGLDALVRAARRVSGVHLLFVGDGTQREALAGLADELGVAATFTGRVPFGDVPRYLGAMDAFAVPRQDATITRYAAPIKAVEAMGVGLPVVGSAVGDVPELLADGRGALVPPGDVDALAEALRALPSTGRAMGERARDWISREMTWGAVCEPYREVYAHALAHRSPVT